MIAKNRPSPKRLQDIKMGGPGVGGSTEQPFVVTEPMIIMFEQMGKITCHIHPRPTDDHRAYGILLCDLVRHVANAFKVDEDEVWEWVDKERHHPTTEIEEAN